MSGFNFYETIQVRYNDIDAQGHVNNARYLTYIEQARFSYLTRLGLWDGISFIDLGWIVADVHINYQVPILWGQVVRVGVRSTRLGNKSLTLEYQIEDEKTGQVMARAETVMVSYDYHTHRSTPIASVWRKKIAEFEGISLYPEKAALSKD
jgi:acyl-CoA thioester hydrolase